MMSPISASGLFLLLSMGARQSGEYTRWAAFQPGATASYRQSGEAGGRVLDAEWNYLLMEVTSEKAVVEVSTFRRLKGDASASRLEIPASSSRERRILREGTGDLTVEGRSLRCRWVESQEGPELVMKEWTSPEVPGGLVRREVTSDGPRKAKTVLALASWQGIRKE